MGNGYTSAPGDGIQEVWSAIGELGRQLREIQTPDGTQLGAVPNARVTSGSNGGFSINTGFSDILTLSLTVPENRTQALVSASAYAHLSNNASVNAYIGYLRIMIAGVSGPESQSHISSSAVWAPIAGFYARHLTGLTPGDTVSIQVQARLNAGSTAAGTESRQVANATATGLFLR